ncbi:hypothetical protein [Microbacterium sp. A84]
MSNCRARTALGDNEFTGVGTFHTQPDGTIVMDEPRADGQDEQWPQ